MNLFLIIAFSIIGFLIFIFIMAGICEDRDRIRRREERRMIDIEMPPQPRVRHILLAEISIYTIDDTDNPLKNPQSV